MGNKLNVTNVTVLESTLSVTNEAKFGNNVRITQDLVTVDTNLVGAAILRSTLSVDAAVSFNNNATIAGTLSVDDESVY